jgi:surfeit locus 1 family protein
MLSRKLSLGSAVALACAVIAAALAVWQFQRASEKRAIAAAIAQAQDAAPIALVGATLPVSSETGLALDQARVRLSGSWLPDTTLYLDNRLLDGKPGVQVLTALLLDDGRVAWVHRGWAAKPPGDQGAAASPYLQGRLHRPQAAGRVELEAVAYASLMQRLTLAQAQNPESALWTNLDWDRLAVWLRTRAGPLVPSPAGIWPLVFWQTSDSMDGLTRHLPQPPQDAVDKHLGYAFQWLLFCAVGLFFAWRLSRPEAS